MFSAKPECKFHIITAISCVLFVKSSTKQVTKRSIFYEKYISLATRQNVFDVRQSFALSLIDILLSNNNGQANQKSDRLIDSTLSFSVVYMQFFLNFYPSFLSLSLNSEQQNVPTNQILNYSQGTEHNLIWPLIHLHTHTQQTLCHTHIIECDIKTPATDGTCRE